MSDWMSEVTYDMLQGKQQELADVIGVEATLKLCEYVQGNGFYIPKNDRAYVKLRNRYLRKDYAENNWSIKALANKYGLTESSVRKIVKDMRPGQMKLKDYL